MTPASPSPRARSARTVAAGICVVQAAVLGGLAGFYVVELLAGGGSDRPRVVTSAVLILVGAAGLAYLARLWWAGSRWSATPTIVWNVVLIPVAVTLLQAGQVAVGAGLAVVAGVGLVSAAAGRA